MEVQRHLQVVLLTSYSAERYWLSPLRSSHCCCGEENESLSTSCPWQSTTMVELTRVHLYRSIKSGMLCAWRSSWWRFRHGGRTVIISMIVFASRKRFFASLQSENHEHCKVRLEAEGAGSQECTVFREFTVCCRRFGRGPRSTHHNFHLSDF